MEKLQFHKIHLPPFAALLFLLQFLSVAYSLIDNNFFINCGSATNAKTDVRNFVGDLNSSDSISSSFSFTGHSSPVTNSNQSSGTSSTPLYRTARIFRSNSSYEFDIPNNDIYFVRLHFSAFSTPTDLSTALFDVWTSGSSLLLNFTGKNSSNPPIIKEFFLPISPGKFNVYFLPRGSSFAFINAIEVFPANDSYIPFTGSMLEALKSHQRTIHFGETGFQTMNISIIQEVQPVNHPPPVSLITVEMSVNILPQLSSTRLNNGTVRSAEYWTEPPRSPLGAADLDLLFPSLDLSFSLLICLSL